MLILTPIIIITILTHNTDQNLHKDGHDHNLTSTTNIMVIKKENTNQDLPDQNLTFISINLTAPEKGNTKNNNAGPMITNLDPQDPDLKIQIVDIPSPNHPTLNHNEKIHPLPHLTNPPQISTTTAPTPKTPNGPPPSKPSIPNSSPSKPTS